MQMRYLIPWAQSGLARDTADNQIGALHRDIDRLFDGFLRNFGQGFGSLNGEAARPRTDVAETDKDYEITVELPGLEEKDIDVSVTDDVLTIKGEKKQEHEEKRKDYHLTERSFGSFFRSVALPPGVDGAKADAKFKNGVLTVTLPKTTQAQSKVKKIDIKSE